MNLHPFTATSFIYALEALRADEGNAVTLVCSNPEGTGADNELVEVVAAWTDWKTHHYKGETIGLAIKNALDSAPAHVQIAWENLVRNDQRASQTVLTCVYCGQAYPPGTPASQHQLLYAHIQQCPKHPMSRLLKVAVAASHALRSYEFGNSSTELAKSTADAIDEILRGLKGGA